MPQPNSCTFGANFGVDPATNERPGRVIDQSSSSPVVTPDGGVIYGAYTRYDFARGPMFRFDKNGNFMADYHFGWDSTPAVYPHHDTYSIVIKDNHYDAGNLCEPDPSVPVSQIVCVDAPKGPYYITFQKPCNADLRSLWYKQLKAKLLGPFSSPETMHRGFTQSSE